MPGWKVGEVGTSLFLWGMNSHATLGIPLRIMPAWLAPHHASHRPLWQAFMADDSWPAKCGGIPPVQRLGMKVAASIILNAAVYKDAFYRDPAAPRYGSCGWL